MKKLLRSLVMVFLMVPVIVVFTACGAGAKVSAAEMKEYLTDAYTNIDIDVWTGVQTKMNVGMSAKAGKLSSKTTIKTDSKFVNLDKEVEEIDGISNYSLTASAGGAKAKTKVTSYITGGTNYMTDQFGSGMLKIVTKTADGYSGYNRGSDSYLSSLENFLALGNTGGKINALIDNGIVTVAKKKNLKNDGYRITFEFDIENKFGSVLSGIEYFAGIGSTSTAKGKTSIAFDFDKTQNVTGVEVSVKVSAKNSGYSVSVNMNISISLYEGTISAPKGFKTTDYTHL